MPKTSKMHLRLSSRLVLLLPVLVMTAEDPKAKMKKEERAAAKLPPCSACDALVSSFQKGLERTANHDLLVLLQEILVEAAVTQWRGHSILT